MSRYQKRPGATGCYHYTPKPVCCAFHADGGSPDLACGGDKPGLSGIHLRDCAYLAGGDCTCGRGTPGET